MAEPTLEIIRETTRWAVVNKPAGIATERHFKYDTVEARAQVQWQREGASKAPFVGIVHRLDRVTSGCLLLARNKSTLVRLNQAFADRQTEKVYWVVTDVPLPAESGTLTDYLGKDPKAKKAVIHRRPVPGAQEAVLSYRLLSEQDGLYQYEIELRTGRYHQIRAQLAAAGAPVFGDATYGSTRVLGEYTVALHARTLSFPDPDGGEQVSVEAPVPGYWPLLKSGLLAALFLLVSCTPTEEAMPATSEFFAPASAPTDTVGVIPRVYDRYAEVAPVFTQNDDTTYLINFWATWCKPCLEELPLLQQLAEKHRNDKLRVLLVSLDTEPAAISRIPAYLDKKNVTLPTLVLRDETASWQRALDEKWDGSLPTTFIYKGPLRYIYRRNFNTLPDVEAAVEPLIGG